MSLGLPNQFDTMIKAFFLSLGLILFIGNANSAKAQTAAKPQTCLLQYCKSSQVNADQITNATKLDVRAPKSVQTEVLSYKIDIVFRDDVISENVKGATIPASIKAIIAKLETGSEIRIRQVKAKEKSGTVFTAPDLTIKIY